MLEEKPRPEAGPTRVRAGRRQRRQFFLALVLLLVALIVVLSKDHQFWFGADETPAGEETAVESVPNTATKATSASAAQDKKQAAAKSSTEPVVAGPTIVATERAAIPSLDVEVIDGDKRHTLHPGDNTVTVTMPPDKGSGAAVSMAAKSPTEAGPAAAAERVRISPDTAQVLRQTIDSTYPALAPQVKVQGSVVMQARIGADGTIQDMRILSGPSILVDAAREAVRRWQFKPYLQNGHPVATEARIIVNFTIKVLDHAS